MGGTTETEFQLPTPPYDIILVQGTEPQDLRTGIG